LTLEVRGMEPGVLEEGAEAEYLRLVGRTFSGSSQSDQVVEALLPTVDRERSIVVRDGEQLVATACSWAHAMTLPGAGPVPAAAVSRVAVRPTHRRRGLLSRMMRFQLADVHARGDAVAGLFASEAPIYGRFGYGAATEEAFFEVTRAQVRFRRPPSVERVREIDKSRMPPTAVDLAARMAPDHPAFVQRDLARWEWWAADMPEVRHGGGEMVVVVHDGDDGIDGMAAYHVRERGWDDIKVVLLGLLATTDEAYAALWRYLFDVDLTTGLEAFGRHPRELLPHLLVDPRACKMKVWDGLWLRLVDVAGALASRRYRAAGTLTLRVEDAACPWNAGEYVLEAGPDGARCAMRPTSTPDLVLPVAALASAYMGTVAPSMLARAGRIEEGRPGALALADDLLAWPVPAWCPLHF
jgi:predicted acetyltransferase